VLAAIGARRKRIEGGEKPVKGFDMPQTLQAQECRERALECARKAQESTDPPARSMFAELAQQWARLAEMLEDRGKADQ